VITLRNVSNVDELVLDCASGMLHVIIRKKTKYGLANKSRFIPIEPALVASTISDLLAEVDTLVRKLGG